MGNLLKENVIDLFQTEKSHMNSGTLFAQFPVDFLASLEFGYYQSAGKSEKARKELIDVAKIAVFYRLVAIFTSDEWKIHVSPQLKTSEDFIYAILDLLPVLGWGRWKLIQLVPDDQLILQLESGYEAEGYLKSRGISKGGGVCFFATTLAAAMMNIVYCSNILKGKPLKEKEFVALQGFLAEEIECQGEGKECCKIIVVKNRSYT